MSKEVQRGVQDHRASKSGRAFRAQVSEPGALGAQVQAQEASKTLVRKRKSISSWAEAQAFQEYRRRTFQGCLKAEHLKTWASQAEPLKPAGISRACQALQEASQTQGNIDAGNKT
jgi:hypothetical protein